MKKVLIPKASDYKVAQKIKRMQRRMERMAKEELIDKYILGQMTREEEEDFLQKCKEDSELKDMAVAQAWLVKALKNMRL